MRLRTRQLDKPSRFSQRRPSLRLPRRHSARQSHPRAKITVAIGGFSTAPLEEGATLSLARLAQPAARLAAISNHFIQSASAPSRSFRPIAFPSSPNPILDSTRGVACTPSAFQRSGSDQEEKLGGSRTLSLTRPRISYMYFSLPAAHPDRALTHLHGQPAASSIQLRDVTATQQKQRLQGEEGSGA
jgi:hypothetical protein